MNLGPSCPPKCPPEKVACYISGTNSRPFSTFAQVSMGQSVSTTTSEFELVRCLPADELAWHLCDSRGGIASSSASCADVGGCIRSRSKIQAHPRLSTHIHSRIGVHPHGSVCGQVADKRSVESRRRLPDLSGNRL
jgi:hypothetical protein